MKRWAIPLAAVVAVAGLVVAFVFPDGMIRDCPADGAQACSYVQDPRPWPRFFIAAVAMLPLLIVLGASLRRSRIFRVAFVSAGVLAAVGLWWVSALVPTSGGDCPPYPQCFTMGHPYAGPAFLTLVVTLGVAFWLWQPNLEE